MSDKVIKFRPKLEGLFRSRFYNVASQIGKETSYNDFETIVLNETRWVEDECAFNRSQRIRYRAIWMLLRDLRRASWRMIFRDGALELQRPTLEGDPASISKEGRDSKTELRQWMLDSRGETITTRRKFIERMETTTATRIGIDALIADGTELVERLEQVRNGERDAEDAVRPYLQLVTEERDSFTNQKFTDIWSYLRMTWSSPALSTPGRTMQYLIRDAAAPNHAVMGIASLENCTVQIADRDDYLRWTNAGFANDMRECGSNDERRQHFARLLKYADDGIGLVDSIGICDSDELSHPSRQLLERIKAQGDAAENRRQSLLQEQQQSDDAPSNKSELGRISKETEQALYERKRCEQLYRLLSAKVSIEGYLEYGDMQAWERYANSDDGSSAIHSCLIAQKTKHIGSSLMELNTCGAIPPYNEILGGKLVALLAMSPQVLHDYYERYKDQASEIASRLKGEAVKRPAHLVYLGTSSLYYVGSSQYNRLKIPGAIFGSDHDLVWKRLGYTGGYGTMHISGPTTSCLEEVLGDKSGFTKINHVFGEGASPKMRLYSEAIRTLLEISGDDVKEMERHYMPRIVYGACIADNAVDYLLGYDDEPTYCYDVNDWESGTAAIIDYWRNRWLKSRLRFEPIYQRMRDFKKEGFLVSGDLNEENAWTFRPIEEVDTMPEQADSLGLDFLRGFYLGSSSYADYVNQDRLASFHVETELDSAILQSLSEGKSVVLTGNPGDGKTHIIRALTMPLALLRKKIGKNIRILLDASALSNSTVYEHWKDADEAGEPILIAINAAIMYSLGKEYTNYPPIRSAYDQMIRSVVYGDDVIETDDNVVVFDLSKRNALDRSIVKSVIERMTSEQNFSDCAACPMAKSCSVATGRRLIQQDLFIDRLSEIFRKITLGGYHATLRQLQSFVSYLLFGNRTCSQIIKSNGDFKYDVANLVYSGRGPLFGEVKKAFDPAGVSHPVIDEMLLTNTVDEGWVDGFSVSPESLDENNVGLIQNRRRQYYFFNQGGGEYLRIDSDDIAIFQEFLGWDDKSQIKNLIRKLNLFFGDPKADARELKTWSGFRFDNSPRKVLTSTGSAKMKRFIVQRPALRETMAKGIAIADDHVRLAYKDDPSLFLKIDFPLYAVLLQAERGVPVLFMRDDVAKTNDVVSRIWRFIEQLQAEIIQDDDEEREITLLDVQGKTKATVIVDFESKRYVGLNIMKSRGGR